MNNDGGGQPDAISHEANTPPDISPTLPSKRDDINQRLQAFRQLFVGGENAVLPRFKEVSRGAIDKALHVFSRINIPESRESEGQLPESDLDQQLLELWELRSGGDEAVFAKMMELFDKYRENCVKYPNLKNRDSSWKYIAPSTITNLRAAAWLAMDDPTKFDDFLVENSEWEDSDFTLHGSLRNNPVSANAIGVLCQALNLQFGIEDSSQRSLLDIASKDDSAKSNKYRGSKDSVVHKLMRDPDTELPEEFIPVVRRALVLVKAGIDSYDPVLYMVLTGAGRSLDGNKNNWSDASLYLLYLHQQTGLINNPEFRSTVIKLRDNVLGPISNDPELCALKIHELTEQYGFRFLKDPKFWDLREEENSSEDEYPDILGFDLHAVRAKATEIKRLGPNRKFNAASSIGRSASRHISMKDDDVRKNKMYEDVMQEKRELNETERRRSKLTSQYLEITERTLGRVFPESNEDMSALDGDEIRRGLEAFLIEFKDHPELSPASSALINRIGIAHQRGGELSNDAYQLNMNAINRDPFMANVLRHIANRENFMRLMKQVEWTDEEGLVNAEFLMRYMAYKILNFTGTERAGSEFILHQTESEDRDELRDATTAKLNRLKAIKSKDSEIETKSLMQAIAKFNGSDFEDFDEEKPESNISLRQRLLEVAGKVSKGFEAFGRYAKEKKVTNAERVALTVLLLALAGNVLVRSPSFDGNIVGHPIPVEAIRQINPFDDHIGLIGVSTDIKDRYKSLSIEGINTSRERKYVGQVINGNGMDNGQRLGFMPEVVDGIDYIDVETAVGPVFMSEQEVVEKYSEYKGLVVRSILSHNERVVPIGDRDLDEVVISTNNDGVSLTEDPLQALTNEGESEIVVYEVLSNEESARIRELDTMRVTPYEINTDFQDAKELLATLKPGSNIAQVYSSMITNFETALRNNTSQEEISRLIEEELKKFENNFVNQQYYSLDFDFDSSTVAEQLSITPEQGYDCYASAVLLLELFQPLGIEVGTLSGVTVSNFDGLGWTDNMGHVRILIGKPDGKVLEVDFTPNTVPGKTPEDTIDRLRQTAPEVLPTDAEYNAPNRAKNEEERIDRRQTNTKGTPELPDSHQPEVVVALTTLLALIGKYNNRNKIKNGTTQYTIDTDATYNSSENNGKKNIRTECITDILDMFVPLSESSTPGEVLDFQGQALGLLYAAFSLKGWRLKRLNELLSNAQDIGNNRCPIDSERNAMLQELGAITEEYRQKLLEDNVKDAISAPVMPSRRNLLYRLLVDNGWKEH